MPEPKNLVETTNYRGFTNLKCEFFPCHLGVKEPEKNFNCLYCYCPLIHVQCPGPYEVYKDKYGNNRKDCSACKIVHDGHTRAWKIIQKWTENPKLWSGEAQHKQRMNAAVKVEHPRKQSNLSTGESE